jgi:hypothetical protein
MQADQRAGGGLPERRRRREGARRRAPLGGAIASSVVGLVLWARPASACSCQFDPLVFPAAGSRQLPLNVQIQGLSMDSAGAGGSEPSRLFGPDGEVPTTLRRLAIVGGEETWPGDLPILMPKEPLLPNTEYRLEPHPWEGFFAHDTPYTFTTGESTDTVPPPAPAVLSIGWSNNGDPGADCTAGPLFEITLGNLGGLVLIHASPVGSDVSERGRAREMAWYGFGTALLGAHVGCALGWSQPGPHILRVAALDHSGLLSDWTEIPGPLDLNEAPSPEVLAALPVQGNGPKDFARPLYRGEVEVLDDARGCALRAPARLGRSRLGAAGVLLSGLLLRWRRRARRPGRALTR